MLSTKQCPLFNAGSIQHWTPQFDVSIALSLIIYFMLFILFLYINITIIILLSSFDLLFNYLHHQHNYCTVSTTTYRQPQNNAS
ncbi:hypothetical protein BDV33DRAFT_166716 [Aspergillus novoparasiticus]|uniref:Uncharacterized protein n=1 Tax=Aspergillus novoparasiticus TaxID=986946 RepID=A0A5N6F2B0_9EURO|nr:hypothetical protein BDV33DRAFT_166716 [Aspergillus novoparasiticus]